MEREMVIVLGVIGADCHAVGNKILERFFGDQGFKVVNLGVMVSQDEYIDAAIETGAEAIVVQSLYGHGEIDCQGFRERCTERGLEGIVMHVGGNLVVGKAEPEEVRKKFLAMGFDRVVFPHDDLKEEAEALKNDILARRKAC